MSTPYRTVNLLRNQIYPTYQLYAQMANKKTTPQDGLRLAGLTVMQWLQYRLGENAPEELLSLPEPSAYREFSDACLPTLYIDEGFVVDIVSIPEDGLWSLQITEPDLGSNPGEAEQSRLAVPGRVIKTHVGFRIVDETLECGFQVVISEPMGVEQQAEVYRLAFVRQLARNPAFGLRQITPLQEEIEIVSTTEQLRTLLRTWRDADNQLPCILFTQTCVQVNIEIKPNGSEATTPGASLFPIQHGASYTVPLRQRSADPAYDFATFAKYGITFCRSYLLHDSLRKAFIEQTGVRFTAGDIVALEPSCFGCKNTVFPYKTSQRRQDETMEALRAAFYTYPRGKEISFGSIVFLSAARERLFKSVETLVSRSEDTSAQWRQKLALLDGEWKQALKQKEAENEVLRQKLERQKQYLMQLEEEKNRLRETQAEELAQMVAQIADCEGLLAYQRRKNGQPTEHRKVAKWAEESFAGRLVLHPKATALLDERSARNVSIGLICDALDFLATDYWDSYYARITTDEMLLRCSKKYGRPFEISPIGATTIAFTPGQYRIPYFTDAQGKVVDSDLNRHLKIGNDAENLLRIYFLHDDEKQLIVVGSLPNHLRSITVR